MQNRECIVFERTRDTDQRIHEPCACLWVPCSSRLQPIVGVDHFYHTWYLSHLPAVFFLLHALRKIITQQIFCLWSKIIRKASLAQHIFFRFQKRPNVSLYVEYSRTWRWFSEDFQFPYKTTKFYAKWLVRNLGQKRELQYLENLLLNVGISNSLCSRTV